MRCCLIILSILMAVTAQKAIGQDAVEDGYALFFTNQYRNPALNSNLQTNAVNFRGLAEAEYKVKNYLIGRSINIRIPDTRNNVGFFYQTHEQPWASKQKIGLNFARHFSINEDGLLSIGSNFNYYQHKEQYFSKEDLRFPDQVDPRIGFVYPTDDPTVKAEEMLGQQSAFTENVGVWYRDSQYYAGVAIENLLVIGKPTSEYGIMPNFPLVINASFARHFRWGNTVISPRLNYHYQTKDESVHYNPLDAHYFNQINPGLIARFNDKVVAGVGSNMELTRAYDEWHFWNNYQAQFGLRFWEQLWVATQLRFPQSLFGPDEDRMSVGLNVNWLLPQSALKSE